MVKSNFEKQIASNKSDKYIGLGGFFIIIGCVLAVIVALTIKFIQWLFS